MNVNEASDDLDQSPGLGYFYFLGWKILSNCPRKQGKNRELTWMINIKNYYKINLIHEYNKIDKELINKIFKLNIEQYLILIIFLI